MKPCRIADGAETDFAEALDYYRAESEALATRLYDEILRLLAEISASPHLFRMVAPPVRRHFSETFPYAVLYVDKPDHVLVVAVAHLKRRPGYWSQRLSEPAP
jgi:plasmid stabilization system protein ParE